MTRDNALFLVIVVVLVAVWTLVFRLLGGRLWPRPQGFRARIAVGWRSLVAALVALVVASFALQAAKGLLP